MQSSCDMELDQISASYSMDELAGNAYDTAWVSTMRSSEGDAHHRALSWLTGNQHANGSWGARMFNRYDRVISTAASVMALAENEKKSPQTASHMERGVEFLEKNIPMLEDDGHVPVGFEMTMPTLIGRIEKHNGPMGVSTSSFEKRRERKLAKIPLEILKSTNSPLIFNWEFWGDDAPELPLSSNGSLASSPSATAAMMRSRPNAEGLAYIDRCFDESVNGGVVGFMDYEIMNRCFSLYHPLRMGLPVTVGMRDSARILADSWSKRGVAFSKHFPMTDLDDSAMSIYAMRRLWVMSGEDGADVLGRFWSGEHFKTYMFELDPSLMANAHALEALKTFHSGLSKDIDDMREGTVRYLSSQSRDGGWPGDKYYVSPVHVTTRCMSAVGAIDPSLASKSLDWLLRARNPNGLWGENGGTCEETAYAISAMISYHREIERIDLEGLADAAVHLREHWDDVYLPEMWLSKTLYAPRGIIRSAILSTIYAYEKEMCNQ